MNNEVEDTVLRTSDLGMIYLEESTPSQSQRYQSFNSLFKEKYGSFPKFISRAPGRVNLIGEHIDYAGYWVLPMAIENDALIGVNFTSNPSPTSLTINLKHQNLNLEEKKLVIDLSDKNNYKIPFFKQHCWVNYFIAGFNCILEYILENPTRLESTLLKTENINLLVTGNVPFASGLSSSSSLTVCSALAMLELFSLTRTISRKDLAELTIRYERSVGTACGGMDQTICLFGGKNRASMIEFNPIRISNIYLPEKVSFIIANSLTPSPKIETLPFHYNKRVVENRFGVSILAKSLSQGSFIPGKIKTLSEFQHEFKADFNLLQSIIDKVLTKDSYTSEEVKNLLGLDKLDAVLEGIPYYEEVLAKNTQFFLKQRLTHVNSEAQRVIQFAFACKQDATIEEVKELGKLMNDSQKSCKEDYDCSSPQLDTITSLMLEKGAYGSRLTGAGWGGCCITMVPSDRVDEFLQILEKFYRENYDISKFDSLREIFFVTKPGQGACIYIPEF